MKLFTVSIIAVIGIFAFLIYRKHNEDEKIEREREIATSDFMSDTTSGLEYLDENGIPQFHDLADPEVLEAWNRIPAKLYYYFPDSLSQEQLNLLEGTGTLPAYYEDNPNKYPAYMAPRYVTQLPHNVPKPDRYDYVSWLDTARV